jgi:hypothetical protein
LTDIEASLAQTSFLLGLVADYFDVVAVGVEHVGAVIVGVVDSASALFEPAEGEVEVLSRFDSRSEIRLADRCRIASAMVQ